MTVHSVHILTEEGDIVPSTGDPIAVIHGNTPQLFAPPRPSRLLSKAEVTAFQKVHDLLSLDPNGGDLAEAAEEAR